MEQLRLDVTEVAHVVGPIRPATVLLGRTEVARCRAALAEATEVARLREEWQESVHRGRHDRHARHKAYLAAVAGR